MKLEQNQKGIAQILLIFGIVLLVIAAGIFILGSAGIDGILDGFVTRQVVTPTPTQNIEKIENWKTYTNQRYFYNIHYPSEWTIKETMFPGGGDRPLEYTVLIPGEPGNGFVNIAVVNDDWQNYQEKKLSSDFKESTFNSYPALIFEKEGYDSQISFEANKPNSIILITYGYGPGNKHKEVIKQILSTFQLIDEVNPSETSGEGG